VLWEQLTLKQQLGQGASGVIYQAAWNGFPDDVAIKLFKGALTSDGLPLSEMIACVAAGQHPNLISVLGKLEGHPSGLDGLVMPLVGPDFINLASPPSWDSCTRDVYSQNFSPSLLHVLSLAEGVAAAAQYLHSFGIMHGDLYGHNVLHCGQGNPLLGDFGAASFYDLADQSSAEALQRLEVRAFGCLLEELIERCELASVHPGLCALQARCLSESPAERPLFDEIVARLREFDT
jgi:serine/threonine protein kinase